jgi:hypothetical protein
MLVSYALQVSIVLLKVFHLSAETAHWDPFRQETPQLLTARRVCQDGIATTQVCRRRQEVARLVHFQAAARKLNLAIRVQQARSALFPGLLCAPHAPLDSLPLQAALLVRRSSMKRLS